jgi:carbon monoxide dehydrogenase subunit G
MGQVKFTSHSVELPASKEAVFDFLSDLNNFEKMMPEQVINWQSTKIECEFDIKGMARIGLIKSDEVPGKSVTISSKPDTPIELKIQGNIEGKNDQVSVVILELTANLSPILQMMASAPLQNLVNIMADKLQRVPSSEF